jgi:phosphate:Na+ symporter
MDWMYIGMGLLGGLALFLYGMEKMSDALHQLAGDRMKRVLAQLTGNRWRGLATGTLFTAVTQSSSITTVMLVSFVTAGLMTFSQSLGIILGANIGTTITAQMVAFKLTEYSLLLVAGGVLLQLVRPEAKTKQWGRVILGLGLLFLGMATMSESMKPLRTYEPFILLMQEMEHPLLGLLIAAVFTAMVQSSSATMGVVIALASQDLITFPAGIALILGANVGTCATALLASLGRTTEAKRVGAAHIAFNLAGALILLPFVSLIADAFAPAAHDTVSLARQIANVHTAFNLGMALLFVPFIPWLARLIEKLLPAPQAAEDTAKSEVLQTRLLAFPTLALEASRKELQRMGRTVLEHYRLSLETLLSNEAGAWQKLRQADEEIDRLHDNLVRYLTAVGERPLSENQRRDQFRLLQMASELEQVGDVMETNLAMLCEERFQAQVEISPQTESLLRELHHLTTQALEWGVEALDDEHPKSARQVLRMKKRLHKFREQAEAHGVERLQAPGSGGLPAYRIEMDVMDKMQEVFRHAKRIAQFELRPVLRSER